MSDISTKLYNGADEIMERFDFQKVRSVMEFLNWTWAGTGIPSTAELKRTARHVLFEAIAEYERKGYPDTGMDCSTGGLLPTSVCSLLELERSISCSTLTKLTCISNNHSIMFQKVSDGLPPCTTFVRAKCMVTGDIFTAYFDSKNQVFRNEVGEVIVFGDPEIRPDDEWEIVTDVFNQERNEHDRSVFCGSSQASHSFD